MSKSKSPIWGKYIQPGMNLNFYGQTNKCIYFSCMNIVEKYFTEEAVSDFLLSNLSYYTQMIEECPAAYISRSGDILKDAALTVVKFGLKRRWDTDAAPIVEKTCALAREYVIKKRRSSGVLEEKCKAMQKVIKKEILSTAEMKALAEIGVEAYSDCDIRDLADAYQVSGNLWEDPFYQRLKKGFLDRIEEMFAYEVVSQDEVTSDNRIQVLAKIISGLLTNKEVAAPEPIWSYIEYEKHLYSRNSAMAVYSAEPCVEDITEAIESCIQGLAVFYLTIIQEVTNSEEGGEDKLPNKFKTKKLIKEESTCFLLKTLFQAISTCREQINYKCAILSFLKIFAINMRTDHDVIDRDLIQALSDEKKTSDGLRAEIQKMKEENPLAKELESEKKRAARREKDQMAEIAQLKKEIERLKSNKKTPEENRKSSYTADDTYPGTNDTTDDEISEQDIETVRSGRYLFVCDQNELRKKLLETFKNSVVSDKKIESTQALKIEAIVLMSAQVKHSERERIKSQFAGIHVPYIVCPYTNIKKTTYLIYRELYQSA